MPKLALNAPIASLASLVAQTVKNLPTACSLDPWVGTIPGERNGKTLQYSYRKNSVDRGAWQATVHGVAKSQTRLSDSAFTFTAVLGSGTTEAPSDDGQCLWPLYPDAQTVLP